MQQRPSLSISHSQFTGNSATGSGGAVMQEYGTCTIEASIFTSNSSSFVPNSATGAGAAEDSPFSGTMTNCTIANNSSRSHGGGVYQSAPAPTTPINLNFVTVTGNTAGSDNNGQGDGDGGGLFVSRGTMTNCTIANNSSSRHGGGVYGSPVPASSPSTLSRSRAIPPTAIIMARAMGAACTAWASNPTRATHRTFRIRNSIIANNTDWRATVELLRH